MKARAGGYCGERPEANLYVAGGVLAATIQTKFSTLPQKPSKRKEDR
jgi:hypothetical protein